MSQLKNKRILISAATSTIGSALAQHFYQQGAQLILTGRSKRKLSKLHDKISADHEAEDRITLIPLDLAELDQIDLMGAQLYERFGVIDGFVSAAGYLKELGPIAQYNRDYFEKSVAINFTANYRLIQNIHLLMQKSDKPRALFLTSSENRETPYWGAYQSVKAALEVMVKTYAQENKNTGACINLLDPGRVSSPLRENAYPGEAEQIYPITDALLSQATYLLSDACSETGQIFTVENQIKAVA